MRVHYPKDRVCTISPAHAPYQSNHFDLEGYVEHLRVKSAAFPAGPHDSWFFRPAQQEIRCIGRLPTSGDSRLCHLEPNQPVVVPPSGIAQPIAATASPLPGGTAQRAGTPDDPGIYLQSQNGFIDILGQTVAFARSGSKLASSLTLHMKAEHSNAQIQGAHAQTIANSTPTFLFIPSQRELENGVSAGDLVLIMLDVRGDRRQIELGALGAARASKGVSITHQVGTEKSLRAPHKYEIKPAQPLGKGEYAFYLERGEGLPTMLYDFSVQ